LAFKKHDFQGWGQFSSYGHIENLLQNK